MELQKALCDMQEIFIQGIWWKGFTTGIMTAIAIEIAYRIFKYIINKDKIEQKTEKKEPTL